MRTSCPSIPGRQSRCPASRFFCLVRSRNSKRVREALPIRRQKMHVRFVFRDATTGREIFTSEDDGEVRGAASDPAGAETETLLRVADSLVREINHNR